MANNDYSSRPEFYIAPKVLREFENVLNHPPQPESEPTWPDLASGCIYVVRSWAVVETSEGHFESVSIEFKSRFSHWYCHYAAPGVERHGRDLAVFGNGVYMGPRSNLGLTWRAVEADDPE